MTLTERKTVLGTRSDPPALSQHRRGINTVQQASNPVKGLGIASAYSESFIRSAEAMLR